MSFDLYFYKRKTNPLTEEYLATYLTKNISFTTHEHAGQWVYENPETGVYFIIEQDDLNSEENEWTGAFDDFICLNYVFHLNFFRPRFFGFESFPIIDKLVSDLDLFVFDPQDFSENVKPQKFAKDFLKEEWIAHNDGVTIDHFEEYELKYVPLEKSNYLWWFQLHREELQSSLTEDIFVAGVFVLEREADGRLYTVCVWPQHIPIILPRVDYVIIKKVYKSFFKNVEESGLVAYDTIIKKLDDRFENFECEVPDLKVLRQAGADRIKKQFNALKIECAVSDFGKMIGMDKFVNVQP